MADTPKTGSDDSKIFAVAVYFLGLLGWILAYFMKKDDKYVMFHMYQSILFAVGIVVLMIAFLIAQVVLAFIPGIGGTLSCILGIGQLLLWLVIGLAWLFLLWKAWSGERYKLPIIGNYAEKFAG